MKKQGLSLVSDSGLMGFVGLQVEPDGVRRVAGGTLEVVVVHGDLRGAEQEVPGNGGTRRERDSDVAEV